MRGSKGVEIRRLITHSAYLCTSVALLLVACGCGEQLTRMEENQVKLQAMVAANARELATLSSQIYAGSGKLEAGIQDLDADAQGIATQVQTVQDDQRKLQETVVAGDQGLDARATQLQEGQQSLQNGVAQVQTVADRTASDLNALSQQHTALRETVQANQRELNGRMGAVVSNQETMQAGITHLQQADAGLARDIAAVTAKQDTFSAQAQDNHKQVTERLTALIAGQERFSNDLLVARDDLRSRTQAISDKLNILELNQQNHQSGLDRLFASANRTAATITAIAAAQTAMEESLNGNHEQTTGRLTSLAESQRGLQASLDTLNGKADQAAADSSAAVASLQESLRTGREAIAGQIGVSLQNQQALRHEMEKMTATAGQTALAVLTMNNGQATFQQAVQTGMSGLHERADQTAAEVRGMAERQTAFQDGIKARNETLIARAAAIEANQQTLSAETSRTAKVIDRAYADLTGVSVAQDTLQTTFAKHSDQINSRMARIESSQKSLGDSQDVLVAMTGQTAIDILALTNGHSDLQRSIKAGNESVLGQAVVLDQNQKALAGQLDVLTATAGQTALDVLALENDQAAMAQSVQAGLADLSQRTDAVAANQQQMQTSVDVLTATTGQTALDVMTVTGRQDTLRTAIQGHSESTSGQMTKLAENQQKMQSGLDAVTTTTAQTALDVTTVVGRQNALQKAIQSYSESTSGQMTTLAGNQQKIQDAIDTVTATTAQTARDVAAVSEGQAKAEQTAQAGRVEVAAKLETIAQDQQGWLQRFDAAQARIQAMADGIALLDQQLVKLQGALQTSIQNTTTVADANGQQHQQFEAKIAQDVQAMLDAVAQLRQAQVQLQEQMSQVHKTTQSQAETLKATLDQIKQPPAEVKVSDAAAQAEPVTVQTGQ